MAIMLCRVSTASAGGSTKKVVITANKHGSPVDLIFTDVYPVRFYVRDQERAPLVNASVMVGSITNNTDSSGMVKFFYKVGTYSYFASYLDAQQAGTLTVENDTGFEVIFAHYAISLDVMDDTGEPLNVTFTIAGQRFEAADGHFENGRVFGEEVSYTVEYMGLVREGVMTPASEPSITIIYDTHSPMFGDIVPGESGGRPQLTIPVSDPNQHASGLDLSSMKVLYKIEPSDETSPWSSAVTFTSGRDKFTAQFPELPPDSIVKFRIEIKDMEGNMAEIDGKFSTLPVEVPQNNTQNQTNPPEPPEEGQGIPFYYILIGVIIVILAVYMVFRLKSKAVGGTEKG
jgi:hypothetical protein